jgi:RimJ/RimL family protein N-acetyltransferase
MIEEKERRGTSMIRKAVMKDLPRMEEIFAYAREQMKKNGNPNQWGEDRPARDSICRNIENGYSHLLMEDGQIYGTFVFFIGNDPTYDVIENGAWLSDAPYGVIHQVASDGTKKGILTEIVKYCESQIGNLRIDTHKDNYIMQHLLEKNGFQYCGIIYTDDGTKRLAYQKIR